MKLIGSVVLVAVIVGMASASGATRSAGKQVAELSKPAADEIVFTAGGDAIWNRKMPPADAAQAEGLLSLDDHGITHAGADGMQWSTSRNSPVGVLPAPVGK